MVALSDVAWFGLAVLVVAVISGVSAYSAGYEKGKADGVRETTRAYEDPKREWLGPPK